MPRAGRPVITLVIAVCRCASFQRGAMRRRYFRLRAEHIGGADLHAGSTQRERRGDASRIGDGAGRDHRHFHRVDHLRQQREGADWA